MFPQALTAKVLVALRCACKLSRSTPSTPSTPSSFGGHPVVRLAPIQYRIFSTAKGCILRNMRAKHDCNVPHEDPLEPERTETNLHTKWLWIYLASTGLLCMRKTLAIWHRVVCKAARVVTLGVHRCSHQLVLRRIQYQLMYECLRRFFRRQWFHVDAAGGWLFAPGKNPPIAASV